MMELLQQLMRPWGWEDSLSMFWPIVAQGALVAVALGLIGCFLVVRGVALLGDALSHAVLPGIVVGFLIGGSLHSPWILIGATLTGLAAALLIEAVHSHSRVKEDASLGIVFTTLFAIGVVMINQLAGQADLDPGCVLYGNLEYFVVQPEAIWPMAVILAALVLGLVIFYRHLLVSTFDPTLAISLGIPAVLIHYVLMGVLSLTVVASFEAVGAILSVALLIMPGATARLWTERMPRMLALAAVHGVASTAIGFWLSHEAILDTSAAGAICVAGFALFLLSWLLAPRQGIVTRWWARRKLARTMLAENLLKAIGELGGGADLAAVARKMGVPAGLLRRPLVIAIRREWVQTDGEALRLTPAGRHRAGRIERAHELWEQYLQREVGVAADHVHDAAEWIEHHLSEREVEALSEAMEKPSAP